MAVISTLRFIVAASLLVASSLTGRLALGASLIPEVKLGPEVAMEVMAWIEGPKGPSAVSSIAIKDISAGGGKELWAVAAGKQGGAVFRRTGLFWEHVPSVPTRFEPGVVDSTFTSAERIDVSPKGDVWVVDSDGVLHRRFEDGYWRRLATGVKDVGAGSEDVWIIPTPSAPMLKGLGKGTYIVNLTRNQFIPWDDKYGEPTAIDANEAGKPFIVTSKGRLITFLPHATGNWSELTGECIDQSVANGGCDPTRSFVDVAASANAVWVTGKGAVDGDFTFHYSSYTHSGLKAYSKLAPAYAAIATDRQGNLYAVKEKGKVVFSELTYEFRDSGKYFTDMILGGLGLVTSDMLYAFDGKTALKSDEITSTDARLAAGLDPSGDFTMSLVAMPQTSAAVDSGKQCLVSFGNGNRSYWSVCLDGAQKNLLVQIESQEESFPIDLTPADSYGRKVGRMLVFRSQRGRLDIERRNFVIGGVPVKVEKQVEHVGTLTVHDRLLIDATGNRLFFGSSDGANDLFTGSLGSVRIWRSAVDPEFVQANSQYGVRSDATLPDYSDLIVEALVGKSINDSKPTSEIFLRKKETAFAGLWEPASNGDTSDIALGPQDDTTSGSLNVPKKEIIRIKLERKSGAFALDRLTLFSDSEDGIAATSFEQSADDVYVGWQDPRSKELYDKPVELVLLDDNTIRIRRPAGSPQEYTLNRVGEYVQFDSGLAEKIISPGQLSKGHDLTLMSPLPEFETPKKVIFGEPGTKGNLPRGVMYKKVDAGNSGLRTRTVESTRELQRDRSLTLGFSFEVPEIVAFSSEQSFETSVKTMERKQSVRSVGTAVWRGYVLAVDRARIVFAPDFRNKIQLAKAGLQGKTGISLGTLIKEYGTHYANHVVYGALARAEHTVSESEIEKSVSEKLDSKAEGSVGGEKKGKIGISGGMGIGTENGHKVMQSDEDESFSVRGGSVAMDLDEGSIGDDFSRATPISMDLRPIYELLSPVFFDDPAIYVDLRNALAVETGRYLLEKKPPRGLSDRSLVPSIFVVHIDKLEAKYLGTGKIKGDVTFTRSTNKKQLVINDDSYKVSTGKDTEVTPSEKFVFVEPPGNQVPAKLHVAANLRSETGQQPLPGADFDIDLSTVRLNAPVSGRLSVLSESCQCMTACPEGYEDIAGACLQTCPAGLQATGKVCGNSITGELYAPWDKKQCETENPSNGCVLVVVAAVWPNFTPACPDKHKRYMEGRCVADCEKYGLESNFFGACPRPEAPRTKSGRSAGSQCAAGAVPANDCSRIEINYTIEQRELEFSDR